MLVQSMYAATAKIRTAKTVVSLPIVPDSRLASLAPSTPPRAPPTMKPNASG